jgi:hypothetical protein
MKARTSGLIAACVGLMALTACGDNGTGVGGDGTVSASMNDAGSAQGVAPVSRQTTGSFSGTMTGSAQVMIYSDARGWVNVGSGSQVSVPMQSSTAATVSNGATVSAGTYTKVRLILTGFQAQLAAGSVVGSLTLSSGATIALGGNDGSVQIDVAVTPFTVNANSNTQVSFDLNSQDWVTQTSAQSGTADAAAVSSATTASVATQ